MSEKPDATRVVDAYELHDLDDAQAQRFRLVVAASLALGGTEHAVTGEDAIAVAEFVLGPQEVKPKTWGA